MSESSYFLYIPCAVEEEAAAERQGEEVSGGCKKGCQGCQGCPACQSGCTRCPSGME